VQRRLPQIVALERENVEGVKLNLFVMPARNQAVKIGDPVNTKQGGLAIQHKGRGADLRRGFNDERKSVGPVVTVPCEQSHSRALPLNDQPKTEDYACGLDSRPHAERDQNGPASAAPLP